jgi:DNA (cytosine-5)-methyltransferase 1
VKAYYNEIDRYCCDWLQNLMDGGHITPGRIDDRSIADVSPDDVRGYERVHFFAGIAGWDYALDLAQWSGPVWTGSCPCQPFSPAAQGRQNRRQDTVRHLWPHWRRLISQLTPVTVFGEQIAQAGDWFDEVCDDMEALDYSIGAAVLPACSVGLDHARPRLYFVCHPNRNGKSELPINGQMAGMPKHQGDTAEVVQTDGIPGRVGRLRAYGNALVPQVAAEFIAACRS